jgi:hypothetical protein
MWIEVDTDRVLSHRGDGSFVCVVLLNQVSAEFGDVSVGQKTTVSMVIGQAILNSGLYQSSNIKYE